ncbi:MULTISPECIES: SMI1/KNR4 family protein [Flavobacterium]|uniref:SMI1/KNR4 family protein n=1 Tax=Flavobacterium TaxID=237 RepID=UPI001642762C|nr:MULTISPECIES: SMI1/KNR4 family protein [Flavobacterium]MCR4030145.1 SMI1/KNR4 family protein [Flavobacterium panacis]
MKEADQIERIKKKLIIAKDTDGEFKVFGADSHKYILGETVNEEDIFQFENNYKLSLPDSYKAFLLHIGNGGISYQNAAAGPNYGIFPFGENLEEFVYTNPENCLRQDCVIYPNMTDEFWAELTRKIDENEDISDADFDKELGKIFSGILPISSQGCSYYSGLVLNGHFKGRVVNIDIDRQKPYFAFESNFLNWYERWLDGSIPEKTMKNDPSLYAFTLSGSVKYILEVYFSADKMETKYECLRSLLKKDNIDSEALDVLLKQFYLTTGKEKETLLQILTKFDYNLAYDSLVAYSKENLLAVFQFVFWYAKDKSTDWLEVIKENVSKINDDETFRFCTYLLKEMKFDYSSIIIPFTSHLNQEIRVTAYYSLGQLENKKEYLEAFILGLNDKANRVVHTTLQALNGVRDEKLLKYYKNIAERFPVEQDYILVNLNHRLNDYNLSNETILNLDIEVWQNKNKKKWYLFWK